MNKNINLLETWHEMSCGLYPKDGAMCIVQALHFEGEPPIVVCAQFHDCNSHKYWGDHNFGGYFPDSEVVRWAYVEDILPKIERQEKPQ